MMAAVKSAVTTTRRSVRTRGEAAGGAITDDYDASLAAWPIAPPPVAAAPG